MSSIASVFYADGYNLAKEMIRKKYLLTDIFHAMTQQYQTIDLLIDSFSSRCRLSNVNIDCKKGCGYCCYQPVFASIHEVFYMKDYVNNHFSSNQISEIKAKAKSKTDYSQGNTDAELLKYSYPCPLLDNGVCIAYNARPMACRIYMSSDVKSCIKRYELHDNDKDFPALFEFLLVAGRNMNAGFAGRLEEMKIQNAEMRFEKLLYFVLNDDINEIKWLNGDKVLDLCTT
ncbi:MAG: YkgJ family cysteine cluster protein [Marinilabiliaceae bacterium]|nr:YkgJ family cysteine cluster protein [Marinilabiliaceae bacterium]